MSLGLTDFTWCNVLGIPPRGSGVRISFLQKAEQFSIVRADCTLHRLGRMLGSLRLWAVVNDATMNLGV